MTLLFISFWPLENGLTQSTVLPVIKYLKKNGLVDHVILATPESSLKRPIESDNEDFVHLQIKGILSQDFTSGLNVLISMTLGILRYLWKHPKTIHFLWARGSVAGGSAYLLSKIFKLPYGVESFEPHAHYMIEGGAWKRNGLKAKLQLYFEKKIILSAQAIVTVSQSYSSLIKSKRRKLPTYCIPCSVEFDQYANLEKPAKSGSRDITGIYVGKFGDIYYSDEFFDLLELLFQSYPEYYQIILTPMADFAEHELRKRGISESRFQIKFVNQSEVKNYLQSSDIAFCPVKQAPIRKFCSPVKTAEYLAAGLPIIISKDISDDSDFIERHGIGQVIDFDDELKAPDLHSIINAYSTKEIQELGREYRDSSANFIVYNDIFQAFRTL
jgi:glycosyltransferase involved in cell wall biosynthesis